MSAMEDIGKMLPASVRNGRAVQQAPREFLTFRLGAEEYGIDILKVQEIRGYENPTRIVNAPAYVKGVVNLRGVIVPIIDLRLKFALETANYDTFTVVIILNVGGNIIGAVVDAVSDVIALAPEQIKPAPGFDGSLDASFITGIGSVREGDTERMLVLVDIERLAGVANIGSQLGLAMAA